MKAGERETETMDSQKESGGQERGRPGIGRERAAVSGWAHARGVTGWPAFPFLYEGHRNTKGQHGNNPNLYLRKGKPRFRGRVSKRENRAGVEPRLLTPAGSFSGPRGEGSTRQLGCSGTSRILCGCEWGWGLAGRRGLETRLDVYLQAALLLRC